MTLTSPNKGYPLERLEGSPSSMSYWYDRFQAAADQLQNLRDALETAGGVDGVGQAVAAARNDATELRSAIVPDVDEAERLADILRTYGEAFEDSAERANDMIDDIEAADTEYRNLASDADDAGSAAQQAASADDDSEADAAKEAADEADAARDAAKAALDELWEEYERHYSAWDDAYDAAMASLVSSNGDHLSVEARDILTQLISADSAEEVARLWEELRESDPDACDELIENRPEFVGNLDGIPYDVRSDANYEVLDDLHSSELEEPLKTQINALWDEMQPRGSDSHLISFDPNGSEQVTAAVWYGDLDAANVNVLVPGMNSNVEGIHDWGQTAHDLNDGVGDGTATVAWFGYDSPSVTEEPFMGRAEDGAAALTGFLAGLDELVPGQISVVAHSYGSTTAALAIGSDAHGLGVDQFITVGSAGLPTDEQVLANLQNNDELQIFSTLSENDVLARVGREPLLLSQHTTIPETMDGVTEFGSDGGVDANGNALAETQGHPAHDEGGYLLDGSESFYNITEIIATGEPGTEMDGEGSESGFYDLPGWLEWLGVNPYRF